MSFFQETTRVGTIRRQVVPTKLSKLDVLQPDGPMSWDEALRLQDAMRAEGSLLGGEEEQRLAEEWIGYEDHLLETLQEYVAQWPEFEIDVHGNPVTGIMGLFLDTTAEQGSCSSKADDDDDDDYEGWRQHDIDSHLLELEQQEELQQLVEHWFAEEDHVAECLEAYLAQDWDIEFYAGDGPSDYIDPDLYDDPIEILAKKAYEYMEAEMEAEEERWERHAMECGLKELEDWEDEIQQLAEHWIDHEDGSGDSYPEADGDIVMGQ